MAKGKVLNRKSYARNPYVRFDVGEVTSASTPKLGSGLYTQFLKVNLAIVALYTIFLTPHLSFAEDWPTYLSCRSLNMGSFSYSSYIPAGGGDTHDYQPCVISSNDDYWIWPSVQENGYDGESCITVPSFCPYQVDGSTRSVPVRSFSASYFSDSRLKKIIISDGIMAVSICNVYSLEELELSDAVQRIWLVGCSNLKKVKMSANLKIFDSNGGYGGCSSLHDIELPNTLVEIGQLAFKEYGLKDIYVPPSVQYASQGLFLRCNQLTNAVFNASTYLHSATFSGCTSLKTVTLGDEVKGICKAHWMPTSSSYQEWTQSPFSGCTALETVMFGRQIGGVLRLKLFQGCKNLKELKCKGRVSGFDKYDFYNCNSLTNIESATAITSVGEYALYNCQKLSNRVFDTSKCKTFGANACARCYAFNGTLDLTGAISIGDYAFSECTNIKELDYRNKMTTIPQYGFSSCTSLTNITLSANLKSIGNYAFCRCSQLNNIIIPENVTYIGTNSFQNCSSLKNVMFNGTPPSANSAFTSVAANAHGYYLPKHKDEWGAVIDANGYWNGLKMQEAPEPEQPKPYDFFICFHGGNGGVTDSTPPISETYQGFWFHEDLVQKLDGCPFHRADNEFLGWSVGTADFDWMDDDGEAVNSLWKDGTSAIVTQEEFEHYKSIGAVSEDGIVPILHLYAIWTTTVPIKFFNKRDNGWPKLVLPPGLADHITWSTLYDPSPRHGEGQIELPPGRHILCVDVDPGYTAYVNGFMHDDSVSADPGVGNEFRSNSAGTRWAYDFTLDGKDHFDALNIKVRPMVSESGGLIVNCSPSMTPDEQANWPDDQAFDIGKVSILLQRYISPYPKCLYLKPGEEVQLPAGKYMLMLEYDMGNYSYWAPSTYSEMIDIVEGKGKTFSWVFKPVNYRTYSVAFDPNGGTVNPDAVWVYDGVFRYWDVDIGYYIRRLPEPKRGDGREFRGWFTKKVGGEKVSVKMLESGYHFEPLTLYAHWSDIFVPENTEGIPEDATDVVVSWGVTFVSKSAFEYCSGLQSITFKGDAPMVESGAFNHLTNNCVVYVSRRSKGWGVEIPGTWNGLRIEYDPELMPELAPGITKSEVTNAVESIGFADTAVKTVIGGDVDEYNRFRVWAQRLCDGEADVALSPRAAMSYLLGADELVGKEITSNDVRVVAFEVADNATGGTMGASHLTFAFEVAIDGVNIGGGSVAEAVLKENLKKVLGVEGAKSLSSEAFSSDNIDIKFDVPVDGKARFTATPPSDAVDTFFMRVKVK